MQTHKKAVAEGVPDLAQHSSQFRLGGLSLLAGPPRPVPVRGIHARNALILRLQGDLPLGLFVIHLSLQDVQLLFKGKYTSV
jgi:hypothetical protein